MGRSLLIVSRGELDVLRSADDMSEKIENSAVYEQGMHQLMQLNYSRPKFPLSI